jgi:hypothetical protein
MPNEPGTRISHASRPSSVIGHMEIVLMLLHISPAHLRCVRARVSVYAAPQVTLTTLQLMQYETVDGVETTNGRFVSDGQPGAEAVFTPAFDNHTFEYHVKAWPVGAVNFSWTTVRQLSGPLEPLHPNGLLL